ncbi:MAG: hypothetical protein HQ501_01160 [Rhodospirillales bacterium]|nr:hypothetical protein [Rhodospirillales bacterium]
MTRRTRNTLATIAAMALIMASIFTVPTPALASAELMQCMVDCIKSEGKAEKATCKTRCADIPISADPQNHDCMAIFKQCKKVCENDKDCKQVCKDGLMNCV